MNDEFFGSGGACRGAEKEVKCVRGVDCEAGDFGGGDGVFSWRVCLVGNVACFGAVAVEGEGAEGGCCEGEGVPF